MPKCLVELYTDPTTKKNQYICTKGLTLTKVPLSADRCWRYKCPGVRKITLSPEIKLCK